MYLLVLGVHSWNRWVLLTCLVYILIRSIPGQKKANAFKAIDLHLAALLFWSLNLQFVLGVVLYILASISRSSVLGTLARLWWRTSTTWIKKGKKKKKKK